MISYKSGLEYGILINGYDFQKKEKKLLTAKKKSLPFDLFSVSKLNLRDYPPYLILQQMISALSSGHPCYI